jgi:hypothetical protein
MAGLVMAQFYSGFAHQEIGVLCQLLEIEFGKWVCRVSSRLRQKIPKIHTTSLHSRNTPSPTHTSFLSPLAILYLSPVHALHHFSLRIYSIQLAFLPSIIQSEIALLA